MHAKDPLARKKAEAKLAAAIKAAAQAAAKLLVAAAVSGDLQEVIELLKRGVAVRLSCLL